MTVSPTPDLKTRLQAALAGRYSIEREVGRGGMATVYLAEDQKHHRPVAVKILHPHIAAHLGSERFLREIQIAARLSHPHILALIDSGEAEGLLFYIMPFVQGESLRERLSRVGRLPVDEALHIARDVASALGYAHAQGVVHRDIKPENVMLYEGEAMVTDFGIAKGVSAAGSENLTQTGSTVGTPAYMSPEQAAGESELDGRSDLYSLACMLYEMLKGSPPFTGSSAQAVIMKRFSEKPAPLRPSCPGLAEPADQAIQKALERRPEDRFSTATLFAQALAVGLGTATPPGAAPATVITPSTSRASKSVAVLPFADLSPEKDQDYFTDGIAEEIINALTKIQALRVASRSSAFAFKGKNQDIREVGEKLGVSTVLEGSVRKAGNRIRITAQLVNVTDGYQLWSDRFDRQLEDVFAVQDEIAESIVKALRVVLSETEKRALEQARPENVQAYDYYLRGRQFVHQYREKSLQFARRMFQRAIEVDPNFARAYAGLADCSSMLYNWWDAVEANLNQAESASKKALELAPELAEAHASRGFALTLSKRYQEAEQEFETAIHLDPTLFEAYYFYARTCFEQGKLESAARLFEKAAEVRPEDFQALGLCSQVYEGLSRKDDANEARRRTVARAERHLELNPDDARALYFAAGDVGMLGNRPRAFEWLERALAVDPNDSAVLYNVGCVFSLLGEKDRALECLQGAVFHGYAHKEWMKHDSDLDGLRDDPRFLKLLANL
jgi:serine/threonine protein kinase/Flp pilus assembly protein TadD